MKKFFSGLQTFASALGVLQLLFMGGVKAYADYGWLGLEPDLML